VVFGEAAGERGGEGGEAGVEVDPGGEAEQFAGEGDVREAVAGVAGAVVLGEFGAEVGAAKGGREAQGGLVDGVVAAAADVDDAARGAGGVEGEGEGAGDVGDVDKVAALAAVLEGEGGQVPEEAGGEERQDAGVGAGEGLAGAVDVEEAEGEGGDAAGLADEEAEAFLVEFREGVDGGGVGVLGFGGGEGCERAAVGVDEFPLAGLETFERAGAAGDVGSGGAAVKALAVDAGAGGEDEAADGAADEGLEEDGGALVVDGGVVGNLIQARAGADEGGEVADGVDADEGLVDGAGVEHVADAQVDLGGEVGGADGVGTVHVRDEGVEDAHAMAAAQELVGQVGADEAGAAGDEDEFGHGGNGAGERSDGLARRRSTSRESAAARP
jgi:hypothetical protein